MFLIVKQLNTYIFLSNQQLKASVNLHNNRCNFENLFQCKSLPKVVFLKVCDTTSLLVTFSKLFFLSIILKQSNKLRSKIKTMFHYWLPDVCTLHLRPLISKYTKSMHRQSVKQSFQNFSHNLAAKCINTVSDVHATIHANTQKIEPRKRQLI